MEAIGQEPKLVTVFGGTGFLGRNVIRALAKRGYRVRAASRRPNLGYFLRPLGAVGQIELIQANLRYRGSVEAAVRNVDAVINLVGILQESGRQRFHDVQAEGARAIAESVAPTTRLIHVSAIGADPLSVSGYGRSKAEGEAYVRRSRPDAVIVRPSILFGEGDGFFNRFGALARALPVLPLAGAETRFQPVFVGDIAEAIARAVDGRVEGGKVYEFGGPEIRTLRELVDYVLAETERRRMVVSLPFPAAQLQARAIEIANTLTLGLLPDWLKLTTDQVEMLKVDNVVSEAANTEGRTLQGLGIVPRAMEAIVPNYLVRFRKTGQFDRERAA